MKKLLLFVLLLSGYAASAQTYITNGNCKAFFKWVVNDKIMSPVAATAINFYDKTEGLSKEWYWDFGDGSTSREQNPVHKFIHPVSSPTTKYSPYCLVSLTVLTSDNCKTFYSEMINIIDGTPYIAPCVARFKYYDLAYDSIGGTATYQLTNLSTGDSLSYLWQFDNGKTSTEREPKVTFDLKQKERKVCLTIKGRNNCADTFCDAVYVINPSTPVVVPPQCFAGFGFKVNLTVKTLLPALVLDFYSKADPEAIEWKWDFGDGTTSSEANPMHIFNLPNANNPAADPNPFRKICLTTKTKSGCVANYCETINIYMNIAPTFDPATKCHAWFKHYRATNVITIPELIPYKLIDVSEGKVVKRLWQFEDGKTSTEAEPLVSFDFQKPTQKVCLTIYTADSCSGTWCDVIYVTGSKMDTVIAPKPADKGYHMRYKSSFPIQMSSCQGYVFAQAYHADTIVKADRYVWSTGTEGQEVNGLCPTKSYTVKATAPDGTIVSGTFIFNATGSVTELPTNWYITGARDNLQIRYGMSSPDYIVEWRLCDGTIVRGDSIPLHAINCGMSQPNLILKDATGNIIYTENISMKTLATLIDPTQASTSKLKLYPNPVTDVLKIDYSGRTLQEMQIEIIDISGRKVIVQNLRNIESGQNISLNVTSLKNGIYLCRMISGSKLISLDKFCK
jgi:PKD repeat protein